MQKRVKLIHLISSLNVGGAEALLFDLVNNIDKEKFEVSVVSFFKVGGLIQKFENNNIDLKFVSESKKYNFNFIIKLYKLLKEEKPDIVHTHLFGADLFGSIIAKLLKIKLWQSAHSRFL